MREVEVGADVGGDTMAAMRRLVVVRFRRRTQCRRDASSADGPTEKRAGAAGMIVATGGGVSGAAWRSGGSSRVQGCSVAATRWLLMFHGS